MDRDFLSVVAQLTGRPDQVDNLFIQGEDGTPKLTDTWRDDVTGWITGWKSEINQRAQQHGATTTAKNYRSKLAKALDLDAAEDDDIFAAIDGLKKSDPPKKESPDADLDKIVAPIRTERDQWKSKYEQLDKEIRRKELTRTAHRKALDHLASLNWNAGSDEATRRRRTTHITDIIDAHIALGKLKASDTGELALYQGDELVRDEDLRPVSFEKYVSELNVFGVHNGDPSKSSPPSNGAGAHPPAGGSGLTQDQILERYLQEADPAKKAQLRKAMASLR